MNDIRNQGGLRQFAIDLERSLEIQVDSIDNVGSRPAMCTSCAAVVMVPADLGFNLPRSDSSLDWLQVAEAIGMK